MCLRSRFLKWIFDARNVGAFGLLDYVASGDNGLCVLMSFFQLYMVLCYDGKRVKVFNCCCFSWKEL